MDVAPRQPDARWRGRGWISGERQARGKYWFCRWGNRENHLFNVCRFCVKFGMNKPGRSINFVFAFWWIAWLLATVGGPIGVLLLMWNHGAIAKWFGILACALHLISSRMILRVDEIYALGSGNAGPPDKLNAWLFFGGWTLMGGIFFTGCWALVTSRL